LKCILQGDRIIASGSRRENCTGMMTDRYTYDGTFGGFLTAAVLCFRRHRTPREIVPLYVMARIDRGSGYEYEHVRTSDKDAGHLFSVIADVATVEAQQTVMDFFLCCHPDKEMILYRYIYKALSVGAPIAENYSDETVKVVRKAVLDLYREAQSVLPGIEFARQKDVSCAVISPRNIIMPIISRSVLRREDVDDLLLYDRNHCILLERSGDAGRLMDVRRLINSSVMNALTVYESVWPHISDGFCGSAPGTKFALQNGLWEVC